MYLATFFIPMLLATNYFLKRSPELLERRLRLKEKVSRQKIIMGLAYVYFVITFVTPGLDRRYAWSSVPAAVSIIADAFVLAAYLVIMVALKENKYASRIIEVEKGQEVITTGLYSVVRHPMYLGAMIMYILSPLALGSYWAMIPASLVIVILALRILNEEELLLKELSGYREYAKKTRYRLIPGIW
jgi:protein-S-isoprenylcysteine O-methyltransferase Ste14